MISWIQDRLAKNGKWIFSILLVVLLIPFVFTIGNTPGCAGTERRGESTTFFGHDFSQNAVAEKWTRDAQIATMLETGRPPMNEQMVQFSMMSRIISLALADEFNIPTPGAREVKAFIPTLRLFQTPDGNFDNQAYLQFLDSLDTNPSLTEKDVEWTIQNSFRISELEKVLGAQGFSLPSEALMSQQVKRIRYSVEVAEFNKATFDPKIEVTDETLQQYFDLNAPAYEVPEKVESAWVSFQVETLKEEVSVTPDEETLQAYLDENAGRYDDQAPVNEDGEPGEVTLDLVRDAVLADYTIEATTREATRLAEQRASDLAYDLYELNAPFGSEEVTDLLANRGLEAVDLPAVSATERAARLGQNMPEDLPAMLHTLDDSRGFTDAVRLTNGDFGIFFLKGRQEAFIPELADVRFRVDRDFRRAEKDRLFSEAGVRISDDINSSITEGASFKQAVLESELVLPLDATIEMFLDGRDLLYIAENTGFQTQVFEDFTSQQRPTDLAFPVLNALTNLSPGETSPMITSGDTGYFAYVIKKETPEIAKDDGALDTELAQIETMMASRLGQGFLNAMIRAQVPDEEQN